jgi:hypothetical protein
MNFDLKGGRFFYLDETWIYSNLTFKKCWQTNEVKTFLADGSAKNRPIVAHAGSEDGFVTGAQLMYSTKQDQRSATTTTKLMVQILKNGCKN